MKHAASRRIQYGKIGYGSIKLYGRQCSGSLAVQVALEESARLMNDLDRR